MRIESISVDLSEDGPFTVDEIDGIYDYIIEPYGKKFWWKIYSNSKKTPYPSPRYNYESNIEKTYDKAVQAAFTRVCELIEKDITTSLQYKAEKELNARMTARFDSISSSSAPAIAKPRRRSLFPR